MVAASSHIAVTFANCSPSSPLSLQTSFPSAPYPLLCTAARNAFALYAGKKGSLSKTEFRDALCALGFTPSANQCESCEHY